LSAGVAAASVGVLGKSAKALTQPPRTIGSIGAIATEFDRAPGGSVNPQSRRKQSFKIRQSQAVTHRKAPLPAQITNGDNNLYPDKATVFTKCLVHDDFGRVDLVSSYPSYIKALNSGLQTDFESIILGSGGHTLNDPQGGLCYQLQGDRARRHHESHLCRINVQGLIGFGSARGVAAGLYETGRFMA